MTAWVGGACATSTARVSPCQTNNPNSHLRTKRIPNPKRLLGGKCCATALSSAEFLKHAFSHLQEFIKGVVSIQSFTANLTGQSITGGTVGILLGSTAITLGLVSVANMC